MASIQFSQKLKELRLKAGFSQKQVYEHFNIPQSTFSSWEVGKSEPSGDMLIKLCEYYKCDMMKEFTSSSPDSVSHSELQLIKKYRALDTHGKKMVDFTLENEYQRSTANVEILAPGESYSIPFAAHDRTDIEVTDEMRKHDEDLIMGDDF